MKTRTNQYNPIEFIFLLAQIIYSFYILKWHSYDETKFQKFLMKTGITETKPLSAVIVIGKGEGTLIQ